MIVRVRLALLAASFWGLASCAAPQNTLPPEQSETPPPISLPAPGDQNLPEILEQRLAYAQVQTESKDGDCAARLDGVQKEIDLAAANPAFDILLPRGRARLADLEYRLHLRRAYCGSGATPRKDELIAALDAALRAVPLYREGYDYQSMVIMQYDAAITYRLLGDKDKAVAALETAVVLDGDYGFADDAAENAEQLRSWKGQAVGPDPVPRRSITLKFAWNPVDADVAIAADYRSLAGGAVLHSMAATTVKHQIRADGDDWVLSSPDRGDRRYDLGELKGQPAALIQTIATLAALQLLAPDLEISSKGEFRKVADSEKISATLVGDITTLSGELLPVSKEQKALEPTALMGLSSQLLTRPNGVEFKGEQDYDLAISAWIDASLDQGVWYDMQASLLLPGLAVIIDHDIQFAYSRPVPCAAGASGTDCAEILVHATPNPEALQTWLDAVKRPFDLNGPNVAHYASAIDLRLVVDPNRLLPYVTEARRHWYFALDGKGEPLVGSETTVATYRYQ